jgi:two-component system, NtrC family, nitrogen regulation sensor histidine kinase GlnL
MTPPPDPQRMLASLPLATILLDPGQTVSWANPAAEQFFGQSLRRLAGKRLDALLVFGEPRLAGRLPGDDTPISARGTQATVQGQGRRRLDVTLTPIVDGPGWQLVTLHDSATAEALGEGEGDNAALRGPEILAHEIKNPLAGIRGAAQLLARKIGEKDKALTGLIADEVDRIAKLIDQMQSLSSRTIEPAVACNLHEAVRRASAVLAAGPGSVKIEEEFDPSLPAVLGSADGLVQVLINLLSNAAEACRHEPQPRVIVRTRFASGLQLHSAVEGRPVRLPIELRVSDNGPGIDPHARDHVFEPFVTTKKKGQGLGLALVRKLVRDMNGRIGHDRDEAEGWTHFRVHLPVATERAERRGRAAA